VSLQKLLLLLPPELFSQNRHCDMLWNSVPWALYPNTAQNRLPIGFEFTMLRLAPPSRLTGVSGFELSTSRALSLAKDSYCA